MDFLQDAISTVHDYRPVDDSQLESFNHRLKQRSTAVLIPCLFDELRRQALSMTREVLRRFTNLHCLVVALAADKVEEVEEARRFFADLPFNVQVLWTNGPVVRELMQQTQAGGLDVMGPAGKGWAVWQGLGVATLESELIALFDADIRTFSSTYPMRMLSPLLERQFGIAYVKAFYSRLSIEEGRMHGRATRLFVSPILESLQQLVGPKDFLRYLQAYRYPLSGEFAFTTDLALNLRIPCDWGLEVGLLSEVYRNVTIGRIAQVDLGVFDHKHKEVGSAPKEGLQRMCGEILASLMRAMMEHEATALSVEQASALEVMYKRIAKDRVSQHHLDAAINGLPYNRHEEEKAVNCFAKLIRPCWRAFMDRPAGFRLPSWTRSLAFNPNLREELLAAGLKLPQPVLSV
ncbi:MAG: glycosyl transferase [Aphanocapsa feldmannii 277cV]|uniref:Glycosyl transferase n=2 Tax=Aphanocapsa feldmannii TaxID=192050 RepID=A0A524RM64_9CHRO|nr:MAG: glycosyl transferase [Aphanocapsa feldmannii 277cV]TGH18398.1 MAG: glycosyl transferase [Aphanocapsa feldmannii 277cI]